MKVKSFAGKLKTSLYWWLGRSKPFYINDEYKLELLFLDKVNNSAKIRITNLKTGETVQQMESQGEDRDGEE
ncbi:MAG: hypothetical protein QXS12_04735 [Candidatus Caldarchaeum sp.]